MRESKVARSSLSEVIRRAADGDFPKVDGGWTRADPWRLGVEAIVGFTGHAIVVIGEDVSDAALAGLGPDGFGGAHDPRLITTLAGRGGWIDSLDVLLARRGDETSDSAPRLVDRPDLAIHPRAQLALELRDDVRVLGLPDANRSALGAISRGLAGMNEISFEVEPAWRGHGSGLSLVKAVLNAVPPDELVLAAVAPGNAASLRVLLAANFVPLGSVQLFRRDWPN